jgi:hypothetical protein
MKFQASKGHLSNGSLHLKQSEQAKKSMGNGNKVKFHLQQLPKPVLDWKQHN